MRKFPFPRIHGQDYDLCIRSIKAVKKLPNLCKQLLLNSLRTSLYY